MKIGWVFPGQGSQAVGMGKDLCAVSPRAREVFARVDSALGEDLSALCFEGPLDQLSLTANTQPAIVAASMAVLAMLRERGEDFPPPECAAGHSLGEYSALCAAGAISLEDAVRVCRARGRAMQAAVPAGQGAMAAVMSLGDEALAAICREVSETSGVVSPANFNAPGQTVIAGSAASVEQASARIKEAGGKVILLNVSAPFHCALMAPAGRSVAEALTRVELVRPAVPVLANVDAAAKTEPEAIRAALVRQVDSPVQWVKTIEAMRARGVTRIVEIGPGKVLAGLVKRIDKGISMISVADAAGVDRAIEFVKG